MTTLETQPFVALDESAHEFISTFMSHVATATGYGTNRIATIAGIKTLLLAAIERGDEATSAWHTLYRAITRLLTPSGATNETHSAYAYLQAFISENVDLADD